MLKNVLKNKFFILFISFVIIVITARFSPVYSLNQRLITLALGIELEEDNYLVTIEAIKPNMQKEDYVTCSGKGLTVVDAISNIERDSNKKVSLAQCEIMFIQKELIEKERIKFLDSNRLKNMPEITVTVICDKPSEIVGKKLEGGNQSSYSLGGNIRKVKDRFGALHTNIKDVGKGYLSYLSSVTMPYVEVLKSVNEESKTEREKEDKLVKLSTIKGYSFNKDKSLVLDSTLNLAYLLLNGNNGVNRGLLNLNISKNCSFSIMCNKVSVNKMNNIQNNSYVTQYKVNISFFDDESFILKHNENNKKHKLTDNDLIIVKKYITQIVNKLFKSINESKIDLLHLYEDYYVINEKVLLNEKDFTTKLKLSVDVNLTKNKINN